MAKAKLRLVASTAVNRTVTPRRRKNAELRTREHLTPDEVERLIGAAKANRHGHRDALMTLLAFRHGLRASEVVDLRWEQVDFKAALLSVRRIKNGTPSTHQLTGRELRALRRQQRDSEQSPSQCHTIISATPTQVPTSGIGQLLKLNRAPTNVQVICGRLAEPRSHRNRLFAPLQT
jgi:integrase